jgi:hypothetical protein
MMFGAGNPPEPHLTNKVAFAKLFVISLTRDQGGDKERGSDMIERVEVTETVERIEITLKLTVSGRAVRDAAIRMRKGPDEAAKGMIEIGKHLLNPDSREKGEFVEVLVST